MIFLFKNEFCGLVLGSQTHPSIVTNHQLRMHSLDMATPSPSAETPTSSAKELSAGFSAQDTSDSSTRAVEAKSPADDFVQEYVVGFRAVLVLVPVILVYFLLMLDMSVISTAVPSITSEFNSLLDIGWYVTDDSVPVPLRTSKIDSL